MIILYELSHNREIRHRFNNFVAEAERTRLRWSEVMLSDESKTPSLFSNKSCLATQRKDKPREDQRQGPGYERCEEDADH